MGLFEHSSTSCTGKKCAMQDDNCSDDIFRWRVVLKINEFFFYVYALDSFDW